VVCGRNKSDMHDIDRAKFLLYGEAVCSVDRILTGCQSGSFCTIQGWSTVSCFFLFFAEPCMYFILCGIL
jgi:hypothetical protein